MMLNLSHLFLQSLESLRHVLLGRSLLQDYVEGLNGQLRLFYLPPYAPHLNPDEQVWAHVKRRVSKQAVQAKDDMKKLALGALRRLQKLPRLVRSFFLQPECQYARHRLYFVKG